MTLLNKCFLFILFNLVIFISFVQSQEYNLVWSDEFDGAELDTKKWSYMLGTGTNYSLPAGWGNSELQYYRNENATVENGILSITAKKEDFAGSNYTSARLRTKKKAEFKYGKIEARIKLPSGQGLWSAFWMLPTDEVYGSWACSGEIDIMEAVNTGTEVHGTLHFGGNWPNNTSSGATYKSGGTDLSDDFHIYTLEWEEKEIRWYVDGEIYSTKTSWWSANGDYPAPFDQEFHILMNLAVGGIWPGNPDASTQFPAQLQVDWIRVYQINGNSSVSPCQSSVNKLFKLEQNYPNPFNMQTQISFSLINHAQVCLEIFDLLGHKKKILLQDHFSAGTHSICWDGTDEYGRELASGIYYYRLWAQGETINLTDQKKLVLIK